MNALIRQYGVEQSTWARLLWGRRPMWTVVRVVLLIFLSVCVCSFVLCPVRIKGRSMEPTYFDGQVRFVNDLAYLWHPPRRGDVICFHDAMDGRIMVKRIVGLPGEIIAFHNGTIFINGRGISEPYLTNQGAWEWPEETLAENTFFVTGDNRAISQQVRVRSGDIIGKVLSLRP